ncbi:MULTISPECIES: hypothetical protein [unclassified Mesorhizobium]|uniref:hypothetical protein n=1 Tax=unclassified Mesorhizobium TaxID=325217 RepID=UPI000FCA90BA|nr:MULTISPECIES: hypothetical protein [unclassified Mesorhizobium]RUX95236.1 hypothetical protein EN993_12420 [Mesorhizobium sp. M7D.F.Ca.US.004.01.2.1]RVA25310.1 hypothetical protein EN935_24510 [Mesorhizobium sp. M7D.F.Ca.US.004.03.1.1]
MRYNYSTHLRDDVSSAVVTAFKRTGIVNITAVAEHVRVKNLAENVALEDIEYLVLQAAQLIGVAIEFDGMAGMFVDGLAGEDGERLNASVDLPHPASLQ